MKDNFYDILKTRRSNYQIGKDEILSPEQIEDLILMSLCHTPAAFNNQTARVIALFGEQHLQLWDFVWQSLQKNVNPKKLINTKAKINGFSAGYCTLLFFTDMNEVYNMEKKFPTYADKFVSWTDQSIGMLQYVIWAALDNEGLGVSLQHYNPLIDEDVKSKWQVPSHWKLISQMVAGNPIEPPKPKTQVNPLDKYIRFD